MTTSGTSSTTSPTWSSDPHFSYQTTSSTAHLTSSIKITNILQRWQVLAVPVSVLTFFIIILLHPAPGWLHYKMNWTSGLILYSLPLSLSFSLSTFIKYKSLPAGRLEAAPGCGWVRWYLLHSSQLANSWLVHFIFADQFLLPSQSSVPTNYVPTHK